MGRQSVRIATALGDGVRPDLEDGQAVPDFLASIRALGQRLKAAMARLLSADGDVFALRARLSALGARRDALTSALARAIVRLRRCVLERLALYSPRSYRPNPLLRHADLITGIFARDDLMELLGEPAYEDATDPRVPAKLVETAAAELLAVIDLFSYIYGGHHAWPPASDRIASNQPVSGEEK